MRLKHFVLYVQDPNIWALFLSHYAHNDVAHLLNNLFAYVIVMFYILLFETSRRRFYMVSISIFLVLPFLLSFINLVVFRDLFVTVVGFSGLASAFFGYFVYAFYRYVKEHHIHGLGYMFPLTIFLVNNLIAIVLYYPSLIQYAALVLVFLVICLAVYLIADRPGVLKMFRLMKTALVDSTLIGWVLYGGLILILFLEYPFLIEPPTPGAGAVANIAAHFMGYLFGFFMPLATFEIYDYLKSRSYKDIQL
jgi:hypothetical protein